MARVLITGASGFIGFHLTKALVERGDQVTALVRRTSQVDRIEPLGVELLQGDVLDPPSLASAVAGCSVVYHLAGCWKSSTKQEFYRVNETGTEYVCQACADQPQPPVLVLASSLAAVGPAIKGRPRTETDTARPVSHYGRSKRAAELVAERYADRIPITVVRPPTVFGQADPACLQMFRSIQMTGIHFVPGYRPRNYSVIHAQDLARLLRLAAERGGRLPSTDQRRQAGAGQGYYFADGGEPVSYNRLGWMMARALGRRGAVCLPLGPLLVWLVAAASDMLARLRGQAAFLSIDKAREATGGGWACSSEKAARELGFSVTVPLADRLQQTVQWYRQEGWLR